MDWTVTIVDAITGVVAMALLGLLGLFFAWVKGFVKDARLKAALDMLEGATATTVGELQQTMVEGFKAANEDGKLSKGEVKKLQRDALALVKDRLAPAARATITAAGLDLEDRIKAEIEATITAMKASAISVNTEMALEPLE